MYFGRWLLFHYVLGYWKLFFQVCGLVMLFTKVSKRSVLRRNVTMFPVAVRCISLSRLCVWLPNLPKGNELLGNLSIFKKWLFFEFSMQWSAHNSTSTANVIFPCDSCSQPFWGRRDLITSGLLLLSLSDPSEFMIQQWFAFQSPLFLYSSKYEEP